MALRYRVSYFTSIYVQSWAFLYHFLHKTTKLLLKEAMLWCHCKIWLYKGHNHSHHAVLSFYPSPWSVAQPDAQRTVSFLLFEALRQNCIFFLGSLQPDVRLFVNYLGSFFGIWEVHLRWCLHYWVPWGLHDDDRLLPLAAYTIDIIIHEFLKPMQISGHSQMKLMYAYMVGHTIVERSFY